MAADVGYDEQGRPVLIESVPQVIHGVECYEAWRDDKTCPHESAADQPLGSGPRAQDHSDDSHLIHDYRWCFAYGGIVHWNEGEPAGCSWCLDDESKHKRVAVVDA